MQPNNATKFTCIYVIKFCCLVFLNYIIERPLIDRNLHPCIQRNDTSSFTVNIC